MNTRMEVPDAARWRPVATPPTPKPIDVTRAHAINYGLGFGLVAVCVAAAALVSLTAAGVRVSLEVAGACILAAFVVGAVTCAVKLVTFTDEHRRWLYSMEALAGVDIDGDGVTGAPLPGVPPEGVLVRGIDGAYHRIDVNLTEAEVKAIKAHLLTSGSFGVRAINTLLGDETRASALRVELHRLGILEAPAARVSTKLTEAGVHAVRRWQG